MTARKKLMAIITDHNIPKLNAREIAEEILEMFAEIEVTVVVKGGVAEVTKNPCGVTVKIKDMD